METPLETIEYNGYTIEIHYDPYVEDPSKIFDNYGENEVQAWRDGEVYGYITKDPNGNVDDSCWGYYGEMPYCISEAKAAVDASIENEKEAAEQSARICAL